MADSNNNFFGWNDEIKTDSQGFILLPEGEYRFQVQKLEKSTYTGSSEKIGAGCPMAIIGLQIFSPQGNTSVEDKLYLCKNMEWKLSAFFRSLGFKQHGKGYVMDWDKVLGSEGRCKLKIEKWISNKDGSEKQSNRVDQYIDSAAPGSAAAQAPTAPADLGNMPFEL